MRSCLERSTVVNNSRHKSRPNCYRKKPTRTWNKMVTVGQAFASEFLMSQRARVFSLAPPRNLWGKRLKLKPGFCLLHRHFCYEQNATIVIELIKSRSQVWGEFNYEKIHISPKLGWHWHRMKLPNRQMRVAKHLIRFENVEPVVDNEERTGVHWRHTVFFCTRSFAMQTRSENSGFRAFP